MTDDLLVTTGSAADAIGVSRERIRQLALTGDLATATTTPTGLRLFRLRDVQEYRDRRQLKREAKAANGSCA